MRCCYFGCFRMSRNGYLNGSTAHASNPLLQSFNTSLIRSLTRYLYLTDFSEGRTLTYKEFLIILLRICSAELIIWFTIVSNLNRPVYTYIFNVLHSLGNIFVANIWDRILCLLVARRLQKRWYRAERDFFETPSSSGKSRVSKLEFIR